MHSHPMVPSETHFSPGINTHSQPFGEWQRHIRVPNLRVVEMLNQILVFGNNPFQVLDKWLL